MIIIRTVTVSVNSLLPLITWSLHDEAVHDRVRGFCLRLAQSSGGRNRELQPDQRSDPQHLQQ